ncbi:MAG: DUF2808 domain-containing protein [Prochloraceae cyanobacterium]|nr:DUF2808 domain-containing protein [Prochloraceae cyanobacterium]
MFNSKSVRISLSFLILTLSAFFLIGLQGKLSAQSNTGLTLFSGVEGEDILPYYLQWGIGPRQKERYKLKIPGKKMTQGAAKFFITYPEYYDGKFDDDAIEVRTTKGSVDLEEVIWDSESRIIEIVPKEQIRSSKEVEIILHNVKNPSFPGTFYFHCQVIAANDLPIRQHLGTWIINIDEP